MPEADLIDLSPEKHLIRCPHCQKQMVHNWPGTMILFATPKCVHCGKNFLIALNEARS